MTDDSAALEPHRREMVVAWRGEIRALLTAGTARGELSPDEAERLCEVQRLVAEAASGQEAIDQLSGIEAELQDALHDLEENREPGEATMPALAHLGRRFGGLVPRLRGRRSDR